MEEQIHIGSIKTSHIEIRDILKAWIAISIAFAIASRGGFLQSFYTSFIVSSLTVGVGFLLHEFGHKIVAQRYGYFAEFRSFDSMLLLAIAMSFFGFVFAAPGAVMISGRVSKAKSGRISAAGPLVNLGLAFIFLLLLFQGFFQLPQLLRTSAYYGFIINSWLALFNMLPFWLFDGYKILKWSKLAYGVMLGVSVIFMFAQNFVKIGLQN